MMNDFANNNEEIIIRPSVGDIVNELDKIIDIEGEQQQLKSYMQMDDTIENL